MDGRLNSQFQFNPSSMNPPPQIQSAENNSRRYVNPIPHFDINNNFDRFHGNNNIPMVPIGDRQAIMEYRNRVNYTDVGDPLRNLQLPPPPPPSQPWHPQFQNPSPNPNPNTNTYLRPNFIREEPYNPASKRPRSEDVDFAQRRPRMDVNEFLRPQFRLSPPRSPGRPPFCSLPWDHDNHYRPPHHGFVDVHEPRIQRRDPNEDIRKSDGFGRIAELVPHSGGILPLQRRENPPQGPLPAAFGDLREYLHSSSRQARQGPSSGLEGRIGPSPPSGLEGRFSWNSHSPHDARMGQSEQVSTMEGSRRVPSAYDGRVGPSAHSPPEGRPSAHSPLEGRPSMHTPLEGRPNMHSPFEGRPSVHSPLEGRISGSALEGRVGTGAHSSLEGRPNMHSPLDGRISGSALDSRVGASVPSSLEGRIGPGLNPSLEGRIGPSLNLKDKWIEDPKNNAQVTVMGNLTEAASRGESKQKSVTEVKKFSIPDDRGKRKRKATQALNVLSSPEGRQESSSTSVSVSFKANGMVAQETMTSCPSDAQIDSPKLKNVKHRGGSAREQRSNEVIQIKTTKCIPVVSPKNRALQTKKPLSANSRQLSVVSESSSQARQSRSREVSPDSYVEEIGDKIILSTGESKDKSVASANQLLLESRGNATLISTKGHWNSNNTKAGVTGNLLATTLNATAPNVRISVATTQNVSVPATKRLNTATENVSTSSVRTSVATTEAVKRLVTITENINPSGVKTSDETTENVNATSAKISAPASENATPNVTILAAAKEAESLNIKTIVAASENATSSHIKTTAAGSENVTSSTVKPTGAASATSSVKTLVDAADHSDALSAKDESLNTLKIDSAELPTTGSTVTVSLLSKRKSVEMANDAEKQQKKKKESELQTPTKATQIIHTDMKPVLLKESHNIRQNEKSGTLGSTGSRETSGPLTSKDSVKDQKILQKEFGTTPKNPFINPTQSRSDGNAKNKRSRTWHRADKTGTASIENEQSNKKPQSTYVRKGHSLVRAPSSVGLTGTSLDLSSGLNTSMPEKKIKPWSKPVAKWENFQNGNKVAALSKKDLVPVSGGLGVMSLNMASNKGGQHLVNKSNSPSLSTPQASQSTAHVHRPPPLSTCAALPKSSIGLKAAMSDSVSQPSIKINAEKSPSNSLNKDSEIQKEKMPVKTSFRALKKVNEAEATNTPGAAKEQRVEILDKEKRIPPTGISLKTVQPLNHSLSDRKVNAEGEGAEATKVTYVKRKTNQLVASLTSKSSVSAVPTSESSMSQMNHLGQDHYYKRTKNQILRSSSPHNGSLTTGAETKESSISASKSQQPMQFHTAKQGRGNLKSLLDYNRGSALSLISWKLEKYRKRNTVYTKSSNGFSLRRSGILSLGGSNLKWSKSIDQKLKEANEKATKEMVAMEKQRREEKSISKTFSISEKVKAIRRLGKLNQETKLGTSKLQGSRGRLNRAGLLRYKIDQSKQSLQKIGDVEKLGDTALSDGQCHGAARVTTKGLSEFGNQYLRVGNGIKLIRDPKSINRALATEKVRWSLQTARSRLAKKQQYCLFYTRFGKCNKEEGKCKYIHDQEKVAVCTKFLKGVCSNQNCLLTHKIIPERMEDCSYFLQGFCTNEKCPYRHVNVNPKASVCEGFLKGYCSDGDKCNEKHTYICPQFAETGECKDRLNCKLRHLKKKEKQKVSRKNKTASGNKKRYFIAGESASALASLYAQQEALEKSIATTDNLEFISIDASVEETEAHDLLRGILDPMKTSEPQPFYGLELFVGDMDKLIKPIRLFQEDKAAGMATGEEQKEEKNT